MATKRRAFTVVELLVTIGIIVLLASIAIPMAMRAYRNAEIKRVEADLQTISLALEAFKADHGDYPRVTDYTDYSGSDATRHGYRGAILLARSLVAPGPATGTGGDGAEGPGFRTRDLQGRVYGPYLKPESFKISSDPLNSGAGIGSMLKPLLFDKTGKVIFYFPQRGRPADLRAANAFVGNVGDAAGPKPHFDFQDNSAIGDAAKLTSMFGDFSANGAFGTDEPMPPVVPFLLWCAGPDGTHGPKIGASKPANGDSETVYKSGTGYVDHNKGVIDRLDDITNVK